MSFLKEGDDIVQLLSISKINQINEFVDLDMYFSNNKHIVFKYDTKNDTVFEVLKEMNEYLHMSVINFKDVEYGINLLSRKNRFYNISYM